jgi:hypothetical protein
MATGPSRIVQAQAILDGKSQAEINSAFANENAVAAAAAKMPLKAGASEHNHSDSQSAAGK